MYLNILLNASVNLWTCLTFKHTESTLYKSISKKFVKINLRNIFADKYLHFCRIANEAPKNFL